MSIGNRHQFRRCLGMTVCCATRSKVDTTGAIRDANFDQALHAIRKVVINEMIGEAYSLVSIPELSVVALAYPIEHADGILPEGSEGTVVFAWSDGKHYVVEFFEPFPCVVSLTRKDLRKDWLKIFHGQKNEPIENSLHDH